jgi:HlyD family secretion protein
MRRQSIFAILVATLFFVMTISGCGFSPGGGGPPGAGGPPGPGGMIPGSTQTLPAVRVATAQLGYIAAVREYSGDLEAVNSVDVVPLVSGRIESVLVDVGDKVAAGDILATLDGKTYAAQLEQAEVALRQAQLNLAKLEEGSRPEEIEAARAAAESARETLDDVKQVSDTERTAAAASLAQAEAAVKQAQTEYDKVAWAGQSGMSPEALALQQATMAYEGALATYELATNPSASSISPLESQLVQAEAQLALAESPYTQIEYELAQTSVKQAEVAVDLAKVQMDETIIRAPFDGIVAEVYVDPGSMASAAMTIAEIVSDKVVMVFDVEESYIAAVKLGQSASLQVVAYPDVDFAAFVSSIAPVADEVSHTFRVRVMPTDDLGLLRGGMYARLSLLVEEKDDALLVPKAAIFQHDGQNAVYVLEDDATVTQTYVSVGLEDSEQVEIASGLAEGQQVVISGLSKLQDGIAIQVHE